MNKNGFVKIVLMKFVIIACLKTVMETVMTLDSMIIGHMIGRKQNVGK
ncbi:403L [Invertebrate iridescent virus Kaz2018]|uniref:403L n=1 Tax=Invertebrate iridescent virus 6 TaxID=176652 RepID=Q91FC2_IIV6|nr:403L [Invertebrate iridescent virus 6]AAK82263.1 403L [Invertebrate iridescent virus 6]QMS79538.1 hypothetical protein IIV6-T1_396 [Invertebrate iridescent virus 6]QNH08813.1 403L [Invertebrate iridescent virus Kaz2018]